MKATEFIYLDHNATTPISPDVRRAIEANLENWGNPSSIHWSSRQPKAMIREARAKIAKALDVHPLELIFTSGGSESNNTVLRSVWEELSKTGKNEIIISAIEHPTIEKTAQYLESRGAVVHRIKINLEGLFDFAHFEKVLCERTALVSVMYANNETGILLPVEKIVSLAHAKNVLVHSDCVQTLGKTEINLKKLNVDYASFSAHKFYAVKGTGLTFVKKGVPYAPLIYGGGQERHRRGGTENTLGIHAFGVAFDKLSFATENIARVGKLRDQFEKEVLHKISKVTVNHKNASRLSNTSSLIIDGVDGETLLMSLDIKGFAVSTGAACSSGNPEPSPVLLSIGLTREQAQNSLRVSLGWDTTEEQISNFISVLTETVERLRGLANAV